MRFGPFNNNQLLSLLENPGTKTQQEVDFCKIAVPFLNRIESLPWNMMSHMGTEARKIVVSGGRPGNSMSHSWIICFIGNPNSPLMHFGCGPDAESNARYVAELLNSTMEFKTSIGK